MLEAKHVADTARKAEAWSQIPKADRAALINDITQQQTAARRAAAALLDAAGGNYDPDDPLA